jgi:sugar lactone lactonase YvrE
LVSALLLAAACSESEESSSQLASEHPSIVTIAGSNDALGAFADGDAESARFDSPEGLALDRAGENLYVADSFNHAIRKLSLKTKQVTTVAGVGGLRGSNDSSPAQTALLNVPRNLVLDPSEQNLYFTDTYNFVIRKLNLETGAVTTEFGTLGLPGSADGVGTEAQLGSASPFAPWSGGLTITTEPASGKTVMYVADSGNQTIRAVDLDTREVTTIAGQVGVAGHADGPARSALFNKPAGLTVHGTKLYISEANNLTLRELDLASQEVKTVAGKAPANPEHFCENVSPVLPPECGSADSSFGSEARFRFPFGMSSDGQDGLYLADSHNNLIRRYSFSTTGVSTVAGVQQTILDDIPHPSSDSTDETPGTFWHPSHVVFHPPNILYVADRSANCLRQVELQPE